MTIQRAVTEEEILDIASPVGVAPTLVFYSGKLGSQKRRELARLCRDRRRRLLVLDDLLVLFLALQPRPRLSAFFRCALPFTTSQPYVTTAGHPSPEMFFGRKSERAAIVEPKGTHLVFGGRQLGKTALLRDVERRYHDPSRGVIVRYLDLQQESIGLGRPASDLWELIANVLLDQGVLQRRMSDFSTIQARVREWLDAVPGRRILLLLDEADRFLAADRVVDELRRYPTVLELRR
ncbi:MAG TPA: hypothetical protein DFS52_22985, partial [Myxococcales bacterium]|nr:hypothetical protein [Myxococcales bacterium]